MNEVVTSAVGQGSEASFTRLLLRTCRWTVQGLLVALVLLFFMRRLSGGMREALPGGVYLLTLLIVGVLVWWLRWPAVAKLRGEVSVSRLPAWPGWMADVAAWWWQNQADLALVGQRLLAGAVVLVVVAVVFSIAGTSVLAMLVGWTAILASEALLFAFACGWGGASSAEVAAERRPLANQSGDSAVRSAVPRSSEMAVLEPARSLGPLAEDSGDETSEWVEEEGEILPADVVQQMTRKRLADGKEAIEGFLRCSFDGENRLQVVHVAFCPPLATKPELETDQLDGPEAAIKATLTETFGARLEVRLDEPIEQQADVVLRLHAVG